MRLWTNHEDQKFRAWRADLIGDEEIGRRLNRSAGSIRSRAYRQALPAKIRWKRWDDAEKATLVLLWNRGLHIIKISKQMPGRTRHAISRKARIMGLRPRGPS